MIRGVIAAVSCAAFLAAAGCASGGQKSGTGASGDLFLATTTSTQDTGLLDELIPTFEKSSECVVKTVAVGSGEAMTLGERGDADALLVHSPEAEEQFIADGYGSGRHAVMHNDFVLVGPPGDPAGIAGAADAAEAMSRIAREQAPFVSRGDDSGTYAKEMSLWKEAGLDPDGSWYVVTGQGMGATLTIAGQKQSYTLTDRGTFLATSGLESEIEFEGSGDLRNNYHVIVVDHEGTNTGCAEEFSGWIREEKVQKQIGKFGIDTYGEQLFVPDALN